MVEYPTCIVDNCNNYLWRGNTTGLCKDHIHTSICHCKRCVRVRENAQKDHGLRHSISLVLTDDVHKAIKQFASDIEEPSFAGATKLLIEWGLDTWDKSNAAQKKDIKNG